MFDMILYKCLLIRLFALKVIEDAEREGLLQPYTGSRIFEGTVGSTGISIATIAKARCVFSSLPHIYVNFNDNDRGYDTSEKLVSWVFL
jgi:hypothetical protein